METGHDATVGAKEVHPKTEAEILLALREIRKEAEALNAWRDQELLRMKQEKLIHHTKSV